MKVRVLAFHHISSGKRELQRYPGISTSLFTFRLLLLALKLCGYKFCLFQELPALSKKRTIVLNFDDAYHSVYTKAFPFLSSMGIKAHVCITGASITNPNRQNQLPLMTIEEAGKMQQQGWDFINHSMNHAILVGKDEPELLQEIAAPVQQFNHAGLPLNPDYFCLPEGKSDAQAETFIRSKGYKYLLTTKEDLWETTVGGAKVPRINIASQSLWYALYKITARHDSFWKRK